MHAAAAGDNDRRLQRHADKTAIAFLSAHTVYITPQRGNIRGVLLRAAPSILAGAAHGTAEVHAVALLIDFVQVA
jgi:hypothetical protein